MVEYDRQRLNVLLDDLERTTRVFSGCVRLDSDAESGAPCVVGDRAGLLRLGTEIALVSQSSSLRTSIHMPGSGELEVWVSDAPAPSEPDRQRDLRATLVTIAFFAIVLLVLILAVTGAITAVRWLVSLAA